MNYLRVYPLCTPAFLAGVYSLGSGSFGASSCFVVSKVGLIGADCGMGSFLMNEQGNEVLTVSALSCSSNFASTFLAFCRALAVGPQLELF